MYKNPPGPTNLSSLQYIIGSKEVCEGSEGSRSQMPLEESHVSTLPTQYIIGNAEAYEPREGFTVQMKSEKGSVSLSSTQLTSGSKEGHEERDESMC